MSCPIAGFFTHAGELVNIPMSPLEDSVGEEPSEPYVEASSLAIYVDRFMHASHTPVS